mgnify:CR=1 FL=1
MDSRRFAIVAGLGCAGVVLIAAVVVVALLVGLVPFQVGGLRQEGEATISIAEVTREVQEAVPTLT